MQIKYYTHDSVSTIEAADLQSVLASNQGATWVDIALPSDEGIQLMRNTFRFHELAIEDVFNQKQRPKTEEFADHLFIILNPVEYIQQEIHTRELDVFVGKNYLVTVHHGTEPTIAEAQKRIVPDRIPFQISATYLLYMLLDTIVDQYLPIIETISTEIDMLEAQLLQKPTREMQTQLFQLKQNINELWWIVWPQKDILNAILNHKLVFIDEKSQYYLRDVMDHLSRITNALQASRDSLGGLTNLYVSSVSNQLNIAVNRLTIFTVIIGSLSVVTGFYGMNFEHTFPAFDHTWGMPFAIMMMLLISTAIYLVFRRQ